MTTLTPLNTKNPFAKRSAPPALRPSQDSPGDRFTPGRSDDGAGLIEPNWAAARTKSTEAKLTGFQMGALALGIAVSLASVVGVAVTGGSQPVPPPVETAVVQETNQTTTVVSSQDLAVSEAQKVEETPHFSEGRSLLLDRSERVHSGQFDPDPAQAVEVRGGRSVFEESYIQSLLNRDLTQVSEGAPSFTAAGVDESQSSKLYFGGNLEQVGWGYGTVKSGDFLTRPTRMNGRGSGLRDEISQYQLSCIYRLEESASLDGVDLEAGLYRLVVLEPTSKVATPSMQKGVCPGHRLKPSGSGFAGDFVPTQESPQGEQLRVNPDDIVQIWTLTAEEAAQYQ